MAIVATSPARLDTISIESIQDAIIVREKSTRSNCWLMHEATSAL
ncbi:MAG: hypothetical protein ACYCZK_04555 [Microbacteriaceae bacterium]